MSNFPHRHPRDRLSPDQRAAQLPRLGRAGRPKEWGPATYLAVPSLTPCACTCLKQAHSDLDSPIDTGLHPCTTCPCPNFEAGHEPERVLVVAGTYQQFMQYMEARHPERMVRGTGDGVRVGHTIYRYVSSPEYARGYDRMTPVILTGTWWDHGWIWDMRDRFTAVVEDPY